MKSLETYSLYEVHSRKFGKFSPPKGAENYKLFLTNYFLVYSGNWNSSSANNRGSNGNYWSATANNSNNAYNLNFNSTNVNPGTNNNNKYNGNSVRCVAGS